MGRVIVTKNQKRNILNTMQVVHDITRKGYVHGLNDQEYNLLLSSIFYISDVIAQLSVEDDIKDKKILEDTKILDNEMAME